MDSINGTGCAKTIGILASIAAIIAAVIAILAWIMPFSPVGASPFAPRPTEQLDSNLPITIQPLQTSEPYSYPTYTPYPSPMPLPTYTPYPTPVPPTPIIIVIRPTVVHPTPIPYASPTITPSQSVNITVSANQEWQGTGIYVSEGKTITIRYVSGLWNPCAPPYGCPNVDAGGWTAWNYDLILDGCPHAALLVRISTAPSDVFCAKNLFTMQTVMSGTVEFRINDTRLNDNAGSITISIEGY